MIVCHTGAKVTEEAQMDVRLPDADAANWVDRRAPRPLRPWLKLARLDRPVGIWLLMLPAWQAIALARAMDRRAPDVRLLILFAVGAVLMRAAGCAVNDIVDRRIDSRVARTAGRPVASGQISVTGAAIFALACALASLGVVLQLNLASLWLAAASLPLVALYPFMKRISWWPQAWLGLTFNWGVILGFAAALGGAPISRLIANGGPGAVFEGPIFLGTWPLWRADLALYAGGILWTLGYDTIYAVQDMADDAQAGVKSSALRLGRRTPRAVRVFYAVSILFALIAAALARLGPLSGVGILILAVHLESQVRRLDLSRPAGALAIFKSNSLAGLILFLALAAGEWRA